LLTLTRKPNTLELWDLKDEKNPISLARISKIHGAEVQDMDLSPNGKILATTERVEDVILWDVSVPGKIQSLAQIKRQGSFYVSFSEDSRYLLSGGVILDTSTFNVIKKLPGQIRAAAFANNDTQIVAFNGDGQHLTVYDAHTCDEKCTWSTPGDLWYALVVHGNKIFVGSTGVYMLKMVNMS